MALIGYLDIMSRVDTSGIKKGAKEGAKEVESFASKLGGVGAAMGGIGAALGAAELVSGLRSIAIASVELIDSTTDAAARLGVTNEALTSLRFSAQYLGVETEALDGALAKFSVNLGKIDEEGGKTAVALHNIGLNAKELSQLSPDQALKQVASGLAKLPDQASKSAAAMAIFGKQGVAILPFLSAGRQGIEKLEAEAKALGITFDDVAGQKVGDAKDAWDKIGQTFRGVANEMVTELAPAVTTVGQGFLSLLKTVGGAKAVAGAAFDGIKSAALGTLAPLAKLVEQAAPLLGFKIGGGGGGAATTAPAGDPAAMRAAAEALELKGNIEDLNRELKKQVDTFGLSAEKTKVWELSQKGASKELLAETKALVAQHDQLEKNKKAEEELTASAKKVVEGLRTPIQQYQEDLRELSNLLMQGKITQDQFNTALEKSQTSFDQTGRSLLEGIATPAEKLEMRLKDLRKMLKEGSIDEALFDRLDTAANDEFEKTGKALAGFDLTPVEQYVKRRKELLKGLEEGTIDQKQFDRGIAEAHKGTLDQAGGNEPKFASVVGDSAEARSLALKYTFGGEGKDPFGDLKKTGQSQVQLQGSMVETLKSIDRRLASSSDAPELDF